GARGVVAVVLEEGGGDRLRLFRIREHGLVPEFFEEIDEPPPGPRRFDRGGGVRREVSKELLESRRIIGEPVLHDFSILAQHRDLRAVFVSGRRPRVPSSWPPVSERFAAVSE